MGQAAPPAPLPHLSISPADWTSPTSSRPLGVSLKTQASCSMVVRSLGFPDLETWLQVQSERGDKPREKAVLQRRSARGISEQVGSALNLSGSSAAYVARPRPSGDNWHRLNNGRGSRLLIRSLRGGAGGSPDFIPLSLETYPNTLKCAYRRLPLATYPIPAQRLTAVTRMHGQPLNLSV